MSKSCDVQLRWLTADEGGRATALRARRYTPTARFLNETEQFSVVLDFADSGAPNPTQAKLRLLRPELTEIELRLVTGTTLEIMEGARVVARCIVQSLHPDPVASVER